MNTSTHRYTSPVTKPPLVTSTRSEEQRASVSNRVVLRSPAREPRHQLVSFSWGRVIR